MNNHVDIITHLITQDEGKSAQDILRLAYELGEKRRDYNGDIQYCNGKMEEHLRFIDFPERDSIESTINALCAAYDYAAYVDGFQSGAALILGLLKGSGQMIE